MRKPGFTFRALCRWLPALLMAAPACAHDFWIVPSRFTPEPGRLVAVSLRVGEHLAGEPVPRIEGGFERFVVAQGGRSIPLPGRDRADPAGLLRASQPGLHVIAYESKPIPIELPAPTFERYLREEGLESILRERAARGESAMPAREKYVRCAKAQLMIDAAARSAAPASPEDALGLTLELVAEANLYAARDSDELPFRLLFLGKPLAGALVIALNTGAPMQRLFARSDTEGRVRFTLPGTGMWLVKVVHMVAAPAGTDAQWLSFWASLTFERPTVVEDVKR